MTLGMTKYLKVVHLAQVLIPHLKQNVEINLFSFSSESPPVLPLPRGVPAILETAGKPLEAALHRTDAPRTQLRLAATFPPLKVEQALLVQALPPQPNRLVSRLDTFPKASLSVSLKQCSAGKGGVPRLLAQHWQVLCDMRGPCRDDVEGVVDHQAATPLLGHPHRARVLLPQLCHRLRRDQVGR